MTSTTAGILAGLLVLLIFLVAFIGGRLVFALRGLCEPKVIIHRLELDPDTVRTGSLWLAQGGTALRDALSYHATLKDRPPTKVEHLHTIDPPNLRKIADLIGETAAGLLDDQERRMLNRPHARVHERIPEAEERIAVELTHAVSRGADELQAIAAGRGTPLSRSVAVEQARGMLQRAYNAQ